jgi:hypothetical protein
VLLRTAHRAVYLLKKREHVLYWRFRAGTSVDNRAGAFFPSFSTNMILTGCKVKFGECKEAFLKSTVF